MKPIAAIGGGLAGACAVNLFHEVIQKTVPEDPLGSNKKFSAKLLTVGVYLAGALATAMIMKALEKKKEKRNEIWEQRLVTSGMS